MILFYYVYLVSRKARFYSIMARSAINPKPSLHYAPKWQCFKCIGPSFTPMHQHEIHTTAQCSLALYNHLLWSLIFLNLLQPVPSYWCTPWPSIHRRTIWLLDTTKIFLLTRKAYNYILKRHLWALFSKCIFRNLVPWFLKNAVVSFVEDRNIIDP